MRTDVATMAGVITEVDEAYPRQQPVSWLVLLPVLAAAALSELFGRLLAAIVRAPAPAGTGRGLKELRQGPSFSVKPVWIRDADGTVVELEVHGYVHPDALRAGDRIRAAVRPQRRRDLPPRAYQIENFTSGRLLRPHPPTLWTHLGPALILRCAVGGLLAALLVAAVAF